MTETIDARKLEQLCSAILQHQGIAPDDADFVAQTLVDTDLRGVHSHGSMRLGRYVRELKSGVTNPHPSIGISAEGPAFACVDGDGGLGQLVGRLAMQTCMAKARSAGSATVTARRSRHFGAAGTYCLMAAAEDLIGLTMTVASSRLAPTGGSKALFGNNPIALAVPGDQEFTLLIDFAMGKIAAGKLELAAAAGTTLPAGMIRDKHGNPTTDPQVGLEGTIVPIGEHKGYALTLLIEILAGLLGGAPYFNIARDQVADHVRQTGIGHFFMVIDPSRFMPIDRFKATIAAMAQGIKASPHSQGVDEILVPGEIEHRLRLERLEQGIPLAASTLEMLRDLSVECSLDF
jgi:LDH2 family malate/lactate/ureidoglycolate dehydrogenase